MQGAELILPQILTSQLPNGTGPICNKIIQDYLEGHKETAELVTKLCEKQVEECSLQEDRKIVGSTLRV